MGYLTKYLGFGLSLLHSSSIFLATKLNQSVATVEIDSIGESNLPSSLHPVISEIGDRKSVV